MAAVGAGTPDNIDALVVTHCHGDHAGGISVASNKHEIPLYLAPGTERWLGSRKRHAVESFLPGGSFRVGDLTIRTTPLSHDAPDTVALRIEHEAGALGICTDLGVVTSNVEALLAGCKTLFLESNHDVGMLVNGPYPQKLKKRILSKYGHISNEEACELLGKLIPAGTDDVILAHLSETNNTPTAALQAMAPLQRKHPEVSWAIAPQHLPARFELAGPNAGAHPQQPLTADRQMELL
jgi:phosphoribosyl 1,2-cyclic phosphodiesterase